MRAKNGENPEKNARIPEKHAFEAKIRCKKKNGGKRAPEKGASKLRKKKEGAPKKTAA